MKGEDTDSELEEYYRELGIEHEKDELAVKVSKKKKKVAQSATANVVDKEAARKKILDDLIEKTRTQPTYTTLSRVIKIVKQVFFTVTTT